MLRLYTYFRSSAAYRVRIALNLKGLSYESIPVHLLRGGGEQHSVAFGEQNPSHLVPVLEDESIVLSQSLAIIEYLEDKYPAPHLLPEGVAERAQVRAIALSIASDIHPLNNLRVMTYLSSRLEADYERRRAWSHHWIALGFKAIERVLTDTETVGAFCYGDAPTVADCCLVPQVFNALRLEYPLESYPTIRRIYDNCTRMSAFRRAAPESQSDAE